MRSYCLWIVSVFIALAQHFDHYIVPDIPEIPDPAPVCNAGSYVQSSCVNHHVTVALSASYSKHFTEVLWSVNHNEVSISSPTSVTSLLKVKQGTVLCDDKVRVNLRIKSKNGEFANCFVEVGVSDHSKPVFTQDVKDVLVDCDDIPVPAYVAAKDDCDKHVNVVLTEREYEGHDTSTITREWLAVDSCGNSNLMRQVITVQDKEGPELVGVNADITVECDNIPKPCVVVAYDNCDVDNEVTYDSKTLTGSCDDSYRIVRTWSSSDISYNTAFKSQTITVEDTTPPVLLGVSGWEEDVYCDFVLPTDNGLGALDNCDDDVLVKYTDGKSNIFCDHEYKLTRTWTAVDDCGNVGSATHSVNVIAKPPQLDGVKETNVTLPCDGLLPICEPEFSDPCDYGLELMFDETTEEGTCEDEYTVRRHWSVKNICGLDATLEQMISVVDSGPPKFTTHPPPSRTVSCEHIPIYVVTAVDDCDQDVEITSSETTDRVVGDYTANNFKILRSWYATDNCGNSLDIGQVIVVRDTTPPVIFGAPPDMTVECDAVPEASNETVTVFDECPCEGHLDVLYTEDTVQGTCPFEYKLIRLWSTVDCSGNFFEVGQTVHVRDTIIPKLISKQGVEHISIEEVHGYVYFNDSTGSDNCADVSPQEKEEVRWPGSCNHNFHIIRTWEITDDCGNHAEKSYTVIVSDKEPPVLINLPYASQTWECDDERLEDATSDPLINGKAVSVSDNSADDYGIYDVPQVYFKRKTEPGTCDDEYTISLLWWAVDDCGNRVEAKATIFVVDQTPPTISRPQIKVVCDDCTIPDSDIVTVSDACSEVSVVFEEYIDYATSECPSQFIIYRQWSVTDDCGNSNGPVTQTVFVEDRVAPRWIVPAPEDITIPCVYEVDYEIVPIAIDENCYDNTTHIDLELIETHMFVECDHQFRVRRKWIASDCLGNFAFQVQTITIIDDTPPVFITSVQDVTVPCVHEDPPPMRAIDNCGYEIVVKFSESKQVECPHQYVLYRLWIASDVCGNRVNVSQTVTVEDNEKPVIVGPGDKMGNCDEDLDIGDAVCTDDCAYMTMHFTSTQKDRGCPHNYEVTRTWVCTDDCGKSATHTQVVEVADLEAPSFDVYVPPHITAECDDVPRPPVSLGGSDNCGYPVTRMYETSRRDIYGAKSASRYDVIRTWILKDTCGNMVLYDQTIHVDDTTPPVLHNVPAHTTLVCEQVVFTDRVYARDNCDWDVHVDSSHGKENEKCQHSYIMRTTWYAEDDCGNVASASQVIVVEDYEKPEFLGYQPSFHYTVPTIKESNIDAMLAMPRCFDNCDFLVPVSCTTSTEPGCTPEDYTLTRVCTCQDDCGNQGYPITQVIEVEDRDPCPFESVPDDTTIGCEDDLGLQYEAPVHNCEYMVMAEAVVVQSCEDEAIVIKTWTLTDECGNSNTAQQSIFIRDEEPPVIHVDVYSINEQCEHVAATYVNMTDNCDYTPQQVYKEVQLYYHSPHDYQVVQQWYVKDRCENSDFYQRTITIEDLTPPTVGNIPDDLTTDHHNVPPYPDYVACDDNCPTAYTTAEFKSTLEKGTCEAEYTLFREWCCVDGAGHKDCATQEITVIDETPPTFYSCPPDYTQMSGGVIPFPNLVAGDAYGGNASVTKSQTSEYSNYLYSMIIRREWVAEDGCENKETCVQKIFLTEPPSILCVPDNITLDCKDIESIPDVEDVTEEIKSCSSGEMRVWFIEQTTDQGSCEYEYCLIRKWGAEDVLKGSTRHNEEYETSQTICVHDLYGPHWDFPVYRTVDCSKAHLLPDYLNEHPVIAHDDCGPVTITQCCWGATDAYGYHYDYTATDVCGHSITERMQVQVVDMEHPQLSDTPASIESECVPPPPLGTPGHGPAITCTDNCGDPTLETVEYILEQSCTHRYKLVRGWRCTDDKGAWVEHLQTISVVDNEPPQWVSEMPRSMTLECDEELPQIPLIIADDNCTYELHVTYLGETHDSPLVVSYATEILTILRNWIVYDDCGLSTTWTQNIRIYDSEFPVLYGVPESGEAHECNACLCSSVTAVDNCGSPSMHSWNVTEEGTCPTEKTVITYWEAVDDVGHSVHSAHTLVIRDSNPPELIGINYNDIYVECHEVPPPPTGVSAIDDCDPHLTVVFKEELIKSAYWIQAELFAMMSGKEASDGYVEYDIYRTWSATDSCGHHVEKSRTIHVNDGIPPVFIKKPGHTTYDCHEFGDYEFNVDSVTVSDNCDNAVYVSFKREKEDGTCPDDYRFIHTWIATDNKDNSATHIQTVTVWDVDGPKFAYLPLKKIHLPCEKWENYPVPNDVSAADECSSVTIVYRQTGKVGTCEDEGRYLRTWIATDECGNSRTFEQTIIVSDTEKPYCVHCPEVYQALDCLKVPSTPLFTAKDVCDTEVDVVPDHEVVPGSCEGEKVYKYQWTATDNCGNFIVMHSTIRTMDTKPPTFTVVPEDQEYDCEIPGHGIADFVSAVEYTDDCSEAKLEHQYHVDMGTCEYEKTYVFLFTVIDDCGNEDSVVRSIRIKDETPPTFTGVPESTTKECDSTEGSFNVIAVDDCSGIFGYTSPVRRQVEGTCEHQWTVSFSWSATDECGNAASVEVVYTYKDIHSPTIDIGHFGGDYPCDDLPTTPTPVIADNCDYEPVLHYNSNGEGSYEVSSYDVHHHWQVCDNCGNCEDEEATVHVYDRVDPVISQVPDITVNCKDIPPPALIVCHDNCDPHVDLTYSEKTDDGSCEDSYKIIREWECEDNVGLRVSSSYTITIDDKVAPIWEESAPKDTTIECDELLPHVSLIAFDDCDYKVDVVTECETNDDKCHNVTRCVWTATDNCGSVNIEKWTFTVQDSTPPLLSDTPGDVKLPCSEVNTYQGTVEGYSQFWPGIITASDNCAYGEVFVKFRFNEILGTCEHAYKMVLKWSAEDDCGNDVSHHMTVEVFDDVAPVFTTIPHDETIGAYSPYVTIDSAIYDSVASDDCDEYVKITATESRLQRQYNRECENEFLVVRVFTATDECGNSVVHTASISAMDTEPPTLPDIQDITIECDEYEGYSDCEVVPTSRGDEDLEVSLVSSTVQKEGFFVVYKVWSVVDCAYHSTETTQTITVEDTHKPVLSRYPDSDTISCSCEEFPAVPKIKAYDNCDDVSVSFTEETEDGTCKEEYTLFRTWVAVDSAGNQELHEMSIVVYDDEAPEFFCDAAAEFAYAGENILHVDCNQVPEVDIPVAHDDCDPDPEVVPLDESVSSGSCGGTYTLTRVFEATDDCGNSETVEQVIEVGDRDPPYLLADDTLCLFPSYSQDWGWWGAYHVEQLFELEDNCDGECYHEHWSCNATDASPLHIYAGNDNFLDECYIATFGSKTILYVKIDRESDYANGILGRTYHVYVEGSDECGNYKMFRRDIFIPMDKFIYEHKQPCSAGPVEYKKNPPVYV